VTTLTYDGIDAAPAAPPPVDALLLVSFGGPEGPDDVLPFLTNVTAAAASRRARLEEVSRHYLDVFGGVSPSTPRPAR
jgi:ferrochelatase